LGQAGKKFSIIHARLLNDYTFIVLDREREDLLKNSLYNLKNDDLLHDKLSSHIDENSQNVFEQFLGSRPCSEIALLSLLLKLFYEHGTNLRVDGAINVPIAQKKDTTFSADSKLKTREACHTCQANKKTFFELLVLAQNLGDFQKETHITDATDNILLSPREHNTHSQFDNVSERSSLENSTDTEDEYPSQQRCFRPLDEKLHGALGKYSLFGPHTFATFSDEDMQHINSPLSSPTSSYGSTDEEYSESSSTSWTKVGV
jgi:hypothetical protein